MAATLPTLTRATTAAVPTTPRSVATGRLRRSFPWRTPLPVRRCGPRALAATVSPCPGRSDATGGSARLCPQPGARAAGGTTVGREARGRGRHAPPVRPVVAGASRPARLRGDARDRLAVQHERDRVAVRARTRTGVDQTEPSVATSTTSAPAATWADSSSYGPTTSVSLATPGATSTGTPARDPTAWWCWWPPSTTRTSDPSRSAARCSGSCRRRASCRSVGDGTGGWCRTTTVPCGTGSPVSAACSRSAAVSLTSPYPAPGTLVSTVTMRTPRRSTSPRRGRSAAGTPWCARADDRPRRGRARSRTPGGTPRGGRGSPARRRTRRRVAPPSRRRVRGPSGTTRRCRPRTRRPGSRRDRPPAHRRRGRGRRRARRSCRRALVQGAVTVMCVSDRGEDAEGSGCGRLQRHT